MDAIKEILNKVANFVRRYVSLVIPGVIALVALLVIVPITMKVGSGIDEKMNKSMSDTRQIRSLASSAVSARQADIERRSRDAHQKDADTVVEMAVRSTERELISYLVFPMPEDASDQVFTAFGDDYRKAIAGLIKKMRGIDAPSDSDIARGSGNKVTTGGNRFQGRRAVPKAKKDDSNKKILDALCLDRANKGPVYAATNLFSWYDFWGSTYEYEDKNQAIEDCWYSQIGFWIYSDIADSIVAINSSASSVLSSPVKRLLAVSFGQETGGAFKSTNTRRNTRIISADNPVYVTETMLSPIDVESLTSRESDDKIDVVYFSFSVVVSAKSVNSFIKELCSAKSHTFGSGWGKAGEKQYSHNQISLLKFNMDPVLRTDADHERYRYGDAAVVQLDLVCEYLFNQKGYEKIKPAAIKELLGQQDEDEADNGGEQGGQFGGGQGNMPKRGRMPSQGTRLRPR
jgi:hypothetical protein